MRAPIASGAELERQNEAREYYAALAASGEAPISEKVAKKQLPVLLRETSHPRNDAPVAPCRCEVSSDVSAGRT